MNTRFTSDLHTPNANLTTFQKGTFYFGIKFFNHFPTGIKNNIFIHSLHKPIKICSTMFPSYKFILLTGGIFYLELQERSWLSVTIPKVNV